MQCSRLFVADSGPRLVRRAAWCAAVSAGVLAAMAPAARAANSVGDVFVIGMENHNWTQPSSITSPEQIFGNPAAPYLNSLVTPGNANAAQASYAANYTNAGQGVHPSEPNYVWAEAGSNLGNATDADASQSAGNIYNVPHLTRLMDQWGVSWKNYQEDVQLSSSPLVSASGTNGPVNPYNGTMQYNYAVKHNPMAFFTDSGTKNVFPLTQLAADLSSNSVGRYNWITPNQYNDQHTALANGFTYNGTHYTGDEANIAQGDNFLKQIIPQIQASQAYKNNGAIVIWWDESENGDGPANTIGEIVISPLAKGNGYKSTVATNHSSDIKTMQEIFGLDSGFLSNPIPLTALNANGTGYNEVTTVNDLSDLFQSGVVPPPTSVPEPAVLGMVGFVGLGLLHRHRRA